MAKPVLMSYNEWMTRTDRKAWHLQSNKQRSQALDLVDQQVKLYETQPTPSVLETIAMFLKAWMDGKLKKGALDSIRNHKRAVTELQRQCEQAMTLWSPVPSRYPKILIGVDTYRGNSWVPDTFRGDIETALDQMASQPVGRKLLQAIGKNSTGVKHVVIEYGRLSTAAPLPIIDNESRKKVQPLPNADRYDLQEMMANPDLIGTLVADDEGGLDFVPAAGCGAVVTFNHEDKGTDNRPPFVALAHELVHAFHYLSGSCYRAANGGIKDGGNTGLMEEEMRTVGCEKYLGETPSENAIRQEHSIRLRTTYNDTASFANVTRSVG
jgi:hypothetical protein